MDSSSDSEATTIQQIVESSQYSEFVDTLSDDDEFMVAYKKHLLSFRDYLKKKTEEERQEKATKFASMFEEKELSSAIYRIAMGDYKRGKIVSISITMAVLGDEKEQEKEQEKATQESPENEATEEESDLSEDSSDEE